MKDKGGVVGHWLVSLNSLDDEQKYISRLKPDESYMVEGPDFIPTGFPPVVFLCTRDADELEIRSIRAIVMGTKNRRNGITQQGKDEHNDRTD